MTSVVLRLNLTRLTDDRFLEICRMNPDVKFEQNAKGELIVVAPTGGDTGYYNAEINADFVIWNRRTKLGKVFDSSTCFELPNGAKRSPDVSWIRNDRWDALTPDEKAKFPPITPDFVLELLSPTDSLKETQQKMQEYIDNGVKLGWLIDPKNCRAEVYRVDKSVEVIQAPDLLLGEDVLPGFTLSVGSIWTL